MSDDAKRTAMAAEVRNAADVFSAVLHSAAQIGLTVRLEVMEVTAMGDAAPSFIVVPVEIVYRTEKQY